MLSYFKNYTNPFSLTGLELIAKGLTPTYPGDFAERRQERHACPSVSWIVPPLAECEHPAAPPEWGEYLVQQILSILVVQPRGLGADRVHRELRRERRLLRPRAAARRARRDRGGVPDRHRCRARRAASPARSASASAPRALVISPFSAGGYKYSGTLDHTRTLRLIETRFGVTGAEPDRLAPLRHRRLHRRAQPHQPAGDQRCPALPSTSIGSNLTVVEEAVLNALAGTLDVGIPYPLPASNPCRPGDHPGPAPGPVTAARR